MIDTVTNEFQKFTRKTYIEYQDISKGKWLHKELFWNGMARAHNCKHEKKMNFTFDLTIINVLSISTF